MARSVRTEASQTTREADYLHVVVQAIFRAESDGSFSEIQEVRLDLARSKSIAVDKFCRQLTAMENHKEVCPELNLLVEFVYDEKVECWGKPQTYFLMKHCLNAVESEDTITKSAGRKLRSFLGDMRDYNFWLMAAFETLNISKQDLFDHVEHFTSSYSLQREVESKKYRESLASSPPVRKLRASTKSIKKNYSRLESNKQSSCIRHFWSFWAKKIEAVFPKKIPRPKGTV
eukprot:Gregarina_sp_Poly_1__5360@NODE_282_length_10089_cov_123_197964_g244_i0_p6_GENE_NODE_282_length_10089_cov_123_197964_g244_i0NODE_282_length_10089_cov_123_197964_g244_i0_p6_ORF_typecomplete_len231_score35_43_NODE_282_length_10089_cov_123_197964_g244_i018902582